MAAIQAVSARIGAVTGFGIAQNLRRHCSPWLLRGVVTLLIVANVINLGADLGAMGAALGLLVGGPVQIYAVLFGALCVALEVFVSYARYASLLKWATLSLLAYVAVVFAAHVNWSAALLGTLVPDLTYDATHATALVAVLGTTISPYLFFWQAGQEVEELHRRHVKPLCIAPRNAGPELARIRFDTIVGNGGLEPDRNLHHLCHGCDTERTRSDQHRDIVGRRRSPAPDRRSVHVRHLFGRHHINRLARGAHTGRVSGPRDQRGLSLDRGP